MNKWKEMNKWMNKWMNKLNSIQNQIYLAKMAGDWVSAADATCRTKDNSVHAGCDWSSVVERYRRSMFARHDRIIDSSACRWIRMPTSGVANCNKCDNMKLSHNPINKCPGFRPSNGGPFEKIKKKCLIKIFKKYLKMMKLLDKNYFF